MCTNKMPVTNAVVCSKAEALLLLIPCLVLLSLWGFCVYSMFYCVVFCVLSSFAIILTRQRELVDLLCLSSWCLVTVIALWLLPMVPWVCMQWCMIVLFPDHTHLHLVLFISVIDPVNSLHEYKYKNCSTKDCYRNADSYSNFELLFIPAKTYD